MPSGLAEDADGGVVFDEQLVGEVFDNGEIRAILEQGANLVLVGGAIGLGAGAPDGGAFAAVEHAKLNAGGVDGQAHEAAEGVHFADDLAFGKAPNGGVATHLGDGVAADGNQRGLGAEAGGGMGGFGTGMAGSNHNDLEGVSTHGWEVPRATTEATARSRA